MHTKCSFDLELQVVQCWEGRRGFQLAEPVRGGVYQGGDVVEGGGGGAVHPGQGVEDHGHVERAQPLLSHPHERRPFMRAQPLLSHCSARVLARDPSHDHYAVAITSV